MWKGDHYKLFNQDYRKKSNRQANKQKNIEGERILLKNKQTRNQHETSIYHSLVFKTNLLLLKNNAVSENEIVQVCVRSQNKPFV